ncbi:hypothetical protein BaRGS_00012830 [Batillaria attramentaria]|uniref:Uncharacterized protein n=1 Tax=Batillaria attramentaria TaxID=370345 RepID=A0ABD0L962_9CAEN
MSSQYTGYLCCTICCSVGHGRGKQSGRSVTMWRGDGGGGGGGEKGGEGREGSDRSYFDTHGIDGRVMEQFPQPAVRGARPLARHQLPAQLAQPGLLRRPDEENLFLFKRGISGGGG